VNHVSRILVLVAIALAGLAGAAHATRWICPPCGAPCDTTTFSGPGTCPACGMTLIDADAASAQQRPASPRHKVAVLVFSGCEILDFAGPYEMFGAADFDVYTVAASRTPVTTAMGLEVVPKYTFADAPQPDVLVIPGGAVNAAQGDAATLDYIRRATEHTTHTMSVCNGAFILASTGLLDGLSATTTYHNIPRMAAKFPKVHVRHDQRYVDNGHLVTTAGLSAGMDGALHVIARMMGTGYAEEVALGEEYAWSPDGGFVRGAMADHQIPEVDLDAMGTWTVRRTEGDQRHWQLELTGHSDMALPALSDRLEQALEKGKWTRTPQTAAAGAARTSQWRFTGDDGKPYKASLQVKPEAANGHDYAIALVLTRES
jgi:putative intracellular protease/amidase